MYTSRPALSPISSTSVFWVNPAHVVPCTSSPDDDGTAVATTNVTGAKPDRERAPEHPDLHGETA